MNVVQKIALSFIFSFASTCCVIAQGVNILEPDLNNQFISRKDSALVIWTSRGTNKNLEYKVELKSLFDDEIVSYLTRDTFLILPPSLASTEENLILQIHSPNEYGARNQMVIRRKEFMPSGEITNTETCGQRITELLQLGMYPSAYFIYQRYKGIFELDVYTNLFNQLNKMLIKGTTMKIYFKDRRPYVKERVGAGAVHRD